VTIDRARRLEPRLPGLFDELADAHSPDYLEAAIELASSNTQRPAWTFPARWLPVAIVTMRVPTTRLPWRALGVVALAALVLAMAILLAGSRSTRLPEPFGPAANGVIALAQNGDLYTADPQTGEMKLLLGGPERDEWLAFTPDGTRGAFLRWNPHNGALTTARVGTVPLAGGAPPTFVQKDVLHGGEPMDIAPNGRELAFSAFDFGGPNVHISVAALDGSSFRTFLDVPAEEFGGLFYLPPDGHELVYVARSSNLHSHDIRALDVTTGLTRAIVETSNGTDIFGNVSAAPDGKHIAYALRSVTGTVGVHVVGTDGRDDEVVGHAPGANFEASPQWDPQGRRLLIERDAGDGVVRPVIVDLGGRQDLVIDLEISPNGAGEEWAPDGASILAQRTDADGRPLQQELWDARTGVVTPVSWPSVTRPAWQRLAP
jgi:dipeptidyl aminopeptidase/acylaminoacyl peptidase